MDKFECEPCEKPSAQCVCVCVRVYLCVCVWMDLITLKAMRCNLLAGKFIGEKKKNPNKMMNPCIPWLLYHSMPFIWSDVTKRDFLGVLSWFEFNHTRHNPHRAQIDVNGDIMFIWVGRAFAFGRNSFEATRLEESLKVCFIRYEINRTYAVWMDQKSSEKRCALFLLNRKKKLI